MTKLTRDELISYLEGKDENVIALAVLYAEQYLKDGIDITKKLETAV